MEKKPKEILKIIQSGEHLFIPHISVDSVIFGYETNELQVLLLEVSDKVWMLPGGYVLKEEDLDTAAHRNVIERIGLENIFLKQFHTFGQSDRSFKNEIAQLFSHLSLPETEGLWIQERFISVAYYALVNKALAHPKPNFFTQRCQWHSVQQLPKLLLDHERIITAALAAFQSDLAAYPLAYHLLPKKFTMPELHGAFQTIHQKQLDRSRFQKKMFEYDVFERLEPRGGVAHRRPYLYRHRES
ncbi:NUDIX hydrolase [Flagellimonas flava]|uniref:NUDIX domain-containing protein n=1 Tax=Flagellimonas flava TaxID=570519 RepID=A0A1M5IRN5_9FLAO|nr:NUDIX domain-containing protein [Allomuricauda flava]SHG30921.1 NUDIX domain-containing protein [Allomuricauda flava]